MTEKDNKDGAVENFPEQRSRRYGKGARLRCSEILCLSLRKFWATETDDKDLKFFQVNDTVDQLTLVSPFSVVMSAGTQLGYFITKK
jgi:hypothetical protein